MSLQGQGLQKAALKNNIISVNQLRKQIYFVLYCQ